MLNSAASRDLEVARSLKDLYTSVLDTLVALIENGDGNALPTVVRNMHGGRTLTWRASGATGLSCESCGCDRFRYEPEGEGLAFDFCPACWSMRGEDRAREESFNVCKSLEKRVRDLPPGARMTLELDGEHVAEDRVAAVEWWRRAARRKDPEAQLWLGRALIFGEGVACDESEGLALVREAASSSLRQNVRKDVR